MGGIYRSLAALIYRILTAGARGWSKWIAGAIIAKFIIAFGLGLATFTGLSSLVHYLLNQSRSYLSQLPADIVSFLLMAGVDTALGIIGGALMIRVTIVSGRVFFARLIP